MIGIGPLRSCLSSDVATVPNLLSCVVESLSNTVAVPAILNKDR